jgi:hypothetical protein
VAGGTTPGTLYSLNRNSDPTRLAGQAVDVLGQPIEDAVIEMESLVNIQGQMNQMTLIANPRDVANLKKSVNGKSIYQRMEVKGGMANVSFTAVQFDGDYGNIPIVTSPFCPRHQAFLLAMDTWAIESLGPAPHLLKFDGPDFLRVASDDAYEVRVGSYLAVRTNMPVANIRAINFGV